METQLQKKSLYQIREDHLRLLFEIEENDGLLEPEQEQALILTEEEFQDKAVSYGFVVKTFDDTSETIDREIKRLQDLKKKSERRSELFKTRLSEAMIQFNVTEIISPFLKLSFRKSEAVEITDEASIPAEYIESKVVETISKTKIKEAIKAGIAVEGASLIKKQNIQIK